MTNLSKIISECIDGDELAFKELYEQTNKLAFFYAQMFLKDRDDIMNVVQTSYVKVYNKLDTLNDPNAFNAWLKTIVRNSAMDVLRKDKNLNFSDITYDDVSDYEVEDISRDSRPDILAVEQDIKHLIYKILYTLPEEQRICVSMFYFDELNTREIAEELGISENSVKSRLKYARDKIKVEVLELEKQGTKIYGLAPLPFLYFLYHESLKTYKISDSISKKVFEQVQPSIVKPITPKHPLAEAAQVPLAKAATMGLAKKALLTVLTGSILAGGAYLGYDTFIVKDNAFSNEIIRKSSDPVEIVQQAIILTQNLDAIDFILELNNITEFKFITTIKTDFSSSQNVQYKHYNDEELFEYSNTPSFSSSIAGIDISSMGFLLGNKTAYYANQTYSTQELPIPFVNEDPVIDTNAISAEQVKRFEQLDDYLYFLNPTSVANLSNIKIKETKNTILISYEQTLNDSDFLLDQIDSQFTEIPGSVNVSYTIDREGHITNYAINYQSKTTDDAFIKAKGEVGIHFTLNHKGNDVQVNNPLQ